MIITDALFKVGCVFAVVGVLLFIVATIAIIAVLFSVHWILGIVVIALVIVTVGSGILVVTMND